MTCQVDFYLLDTPQVADKSRLACRLAAKAFSNRVTVFMQVDSEPQAQQLDKLLWTYAQNSFVPHALSPVADGQLHRFPVLIGTRGAPEYGRDMLISLCAAVPENFADYARVAELVCTDPEDKSVARQRFQFYRQRGLEPQTHNIAT